MVPDTKVHIFMISDDAQYIYIVGVEKKVIGLYLEGHYLNGP